MLDWLAQFWLALGRPDLELAEQRRGGDRDGVDRVTERLCVVRGGRAETADLTHVLQRGRADVVVGHLLGVRRAQGFDASAHNPTVPGRPGGYGGVEPPVTGGFRGVAPRASTAPGPAQPPGQHSPRASTAPGPAQPPGQQSYFSPSSPSRPTVRPGGREPICRMASRTPGMNEARSRESCLIVSVSPFPPNSTS